MSREASDIRILLIEDDEMSRNMMVRRLERKGFHVESCINGEDGLNQAVRMLPDIILMDMTLPRMDGWVATQVIKSNASTKDIPVIAITAHATPEDRERVFSVGCEGFEPKPILFDKLVQTIMRLIDSRPIAENSADLI